MYTQSSLAQRGPKPDSHIDRGLTLVGATRAQGKVALHVDALSKRYGAVDAVAGVSFDVRQGEIFGLLGLNGAGKTTLISMLATERLPVGRRRTAVGSQYTGDRRAVRRMIGVAPQDIALYPMLTAAENLRFFGRIYDLREAELASRIEQLLDFVGLTRPSQRSGRDLLGRHEAPLELGGRVGASAQTDFAGRTNGGCRSAISRGHS